jgi:hypothetical protein
MALHIKTLQIAANDSTLFVDLQFGKDDAGNFGVRARITRRRPRGGEKFVGYAGVNRALELTKYPMDEITDSELEAIEAEIKTAVKE